MSTSYSYIIRSQPILVLNGYVGAFLYEMGSQFPVRLDVKTLCQDMEQRVAIAVSCVNAGAMFQKEKPKKAG